MDTLQERIEGSFGDGPPLPGVDVHLAAGRRTLRRRRQASIGAAAAVTAAAVLATAWYAIPDASTDPDRFAGNPTPAATPTSPAAPSAAPSAARWPRGELVRYVDGLLDIRPGVVVHEHISNPYHYEQPSLSDALDISWKGKRQWLIVEKRPAPYGITSSSSDPSNGWASFAAYVADQVDTSGDSGWPDTFKLDARGRVVPTALAHVVKRTDDPKLGSDFAGPGETTGAALVSVVGEQGTYFVVWRVIEGDLDVITTPPTFTAGATFAELLTRARAQYASGEGLR